MRKREKIRRQELMKLIVIEWSGKGMVLIMEFSGPWVLEKGWQAEKDEVCRVANFRSFRVRKRKSLQ